MTLIADRDGNVWTGTSAGLAVLRAKAVRFEPVGTLAELIALAKKEPAKLSYASAGPGTAQHLSMELFKLKAGVDIDMMADAYRKGLPIALERGLVSMEQIDTAVRRVLKLKQDLGLFDDPYRRDESYFI